MKHNKIFGLSFLALIMVGGSGQLQAQTAGFTLQQLTDSALHNNHILTLKDWQIKEKEAKIKETHIKRFPSVMVNSGYQYNFNVQSLTIPAGAIGVIPTSTTPVLLPNKEQSYEIGKHSLLYAGVLAYQPLTQQFKINTGQAVEKTEVTLAEKEKIKVSHQIKQGVEKLYYGALIAQKQLQEAQAKLELAQTKLQDVETALSAGKAINSNKVGLLASVADEEQNILKLNIQIQDYLGDLANLTGISESQIQLADVAPAFQTIGKIDEYQTAASNTNTELQIAQLTKTKATLGIKAAHEGNIPDVGVVAGYAYQKGVDLLPSNNPFVGVSLMWNVQGIFSNKQVAQQRTYQLKQAEENIAHTQQQVHNDIEKAYRKIQQSQALVAVAQKAVAYRQEELKLQEDKQKAGLNVKADWLSTKATLAKAQADLYAAQLSYLLASSDLKILVGE
ncbi:Outer membrane protein TolC [Flexibacter flexilis DSM 6793]|uniref:Outer membrane protein TolC n=1 Tax=Flexibacter flexilis DSM 6793 TaxID=927664 RepID=A0A1I1I347_9BACT|nr:TolC family protein [Flexibacter flexilis]SFC30859.1 Outer membrane protein TolC [Flexibacter flexilis DSM 6793]